MAHILIISDNPEYLVNLLKLDKANTCIISFDISNYKDRSDYVNTIKSIDVTDLKVVVFETLYTAPFAFLLRQMGYKNKFIIIPHINPYPLREFLDASLFDSCIMRGDLFILGSEVSALIYKKLFYDINIFIIPTYGIDTELYRKIGKVEARNMLGLPMDHKILLYTGRLFPDKNIASIFAVYASLRKKFDNILLLLSNIKKADKYVDALLAKYGSDGVIIKNYGFDSMPYVYSAADLFITCSTSYFETFGRSPLEAISSGTPVIAPKWMSFTTTITPNSGELIDVDFFDETIYDGFSYAMVNLAEFRDACERALQNNIYAPSLRYDCTREYAERLFKNVLSYTTNIADKSLEKRVQVKSQIIYEILQSLNCVTTEDIFEFAIRFGQSTDQKCFEEKLQKKLFYHLFK